MDKDDRSATLQIAQVVLVGGASIVAGGFFLGLAWRVFEVIAG